MTGPSQHLTWAELACHDAARTPYPAEWRNDRAITLAEEFEAIRALCGGRPLIILSAYRTSDHNRRVGGARRSQHVFGRALDIRCKGMTVEWLENRVRLRAYTPGSAIKGIGLYPTFVHFDIRPSTRLVYWQGARPKAEAIA